MAHCFVKIVHSSIRSKVVNCWKQDEQLKNQSGEIKELKAMVQQLMAKQDKQAATK